MNSIFGIVLSALVIQSAFLGDALLCIPLLKRLKEKHDSVTLLCRKGVGSIFEHYKLVDHVIEIDKKSKSSIAEATAKLKKQEFDLLVCPHESYRSGMLAKKVKAKTKLGFSHWWNFWIFDRRRRRPMEYPDALRQLSLLTLIDGEMRQNFEKLSARDYKYPHTKLLQWPTPVPSFANMEILNNEQKDGPICIAPGSVWPTKRWTPEGFSELVGRFLNSQFEVCLIGGPDERELCESIAKGRVGVRVYAGQHSLLQSIELLSSARLLVTNDSGAMHLGSVAGTPTVSIFGPTTLDLGYRPWSDKAVVVQNELPCRPCGTHGGVKCPIGTHECMKALSVNEVYRVCKSLLK